MSNPVASKDNGAFEERGPLRVAVVGAAMPFGQEAFRSLSQWEKIVFTLAIDQHEVGKSTRAIVGGRAANLIIEDKLGAALDREPCDILVDFSHTSAALQHGVSAMRRGVAPILNASLSAPELRELHAESRECKVPALVAPHLSIAQVLLLQLCSRAAQWMPDFEVVDIQPDTRNASPSPFARHLAEALSAGWERRDLLASGGVDYGKTRTWEDVRMHVLRIKGASPSHEVRFGTGGESFIVSISPRDASSIIDGLKLAISRLPTMSGVTVGLEALIGH